MLLAAALAGVASWHAAPVLGATGTAAPTWNRDAAAQYLDKREVWWQQWKSAQKDHGTLCISCHTVVPYALVRPALRGAGAGNTISGMTPPEQVMMLSVEKRVAGWSDMVPFYSDAKSGPGKTAESHATEAVLNAILLASYDTRIGHLRPVTRTAFDNAWALQENAGPLAGAWKWQDFHLAPWESSDSNYQGAALLMFEALNAPDGYAKDPAVRPHLDRLRAYLGREYATQPLMNQLYVLWASPKDPKLLSPANRQALLKALQTQQQPDGGWRMAALEKHERKDHSPEPTASDGYATGLAVLALEASTSPRHPELGTSLILRDGLAWLRTHQQKDGTWLAASMNKERDPETDAAVFMTDAATGYAVLALENAK
jgi:squalene-hopene/tetraprenyl-beta-curcumene cyclase